MPVAPNDQSPDDPIYVEITNPGDIGGGGGGGGDASAANQLALNTLVGPVTETAPASDTASSGLNGRLQRIAQRLTALIALLPGSLGQKAKAASLAVTIASDQDALPVTGAFFQATQPVSAAALPLPSGAATSAAQATGNTSLGNVDATIGAVADAVVAAGAAGSLSAKLRRVTQGLEDLKTLIALAAGEAHIGAVGGALARTTVATFQRPNDATAYAAGDIVSDNTTTTTLMTVAGAARVVGGSGYIVGARLAVDLKSVTPRFRVHLFNASNPTRSGDNLPHRSVYADISKRVGTFDLGAMATGTDTTNSDMSAATDWTLRIPFLCAAGSTSLYAMLECLDAWTPTAQRNFSLELFVDEN